MVDIDTQPPSKTANIATENLLKLKIISSILSESDGRRSKGSKGASDPFDPVNKNFVKSNEEITGAAQLYRAASGGLKGQRAFLIRARKWVSPL
jgi:hypothetical protein